MTRQTGTTSEVLDAFVAARRLRTPTAPVPGGCRVDTDGQTLYSYRTAIAAHRPDGAIIVGTRKYSVTTSRLQSALNGALYSAGYRVDATEVDTLRAAVPGRWGGYGPAWHATGWENVPAIVWRRS